MSFTNYLVAGAAALSFAGAAQADVLYTSSGFATIDNPGVNAWCSSCGGSYDVLNPFTLGAGSIVNGAETAVQTDYGSSWNVTVSIWDSTRTTVLDSATFSSGYGVTDLGNDVSEVTFTLPSWKLAAGNYWISFYDPSFLAIPGYYTGGADQQYDIGYGFLGTSGAYEVSGVSAVPEASELSLMAAGLALVGVVARRRRQA